MRALIVYCHPDPSSFTAAVRDRILSVLCDRSIACRLVDLYALGFDPVLSAGALANYADFPDNTHQVADQVQDLQWADTLIFVYPTWWHGLPAMLKGWLDRVLLPGVAFELPPTQGGQIAPTLTHIDTILVFTSCGASRWVSWMMGSLGRRTLLRGLRAMCGRKCQTRFHALYAMDRATAQSRAAHLEKVAKTIAKI